MPVIPGNSGRQEIRGSEHGRCGAATRGPSPAGDSPLYRPARQAEPTASTQFGRSGIEELLAGWLPRQRWYPGRGTAVTGLSIISEATLRAGDPSLRHLIVEARLRHGPTMFQVLLGSRAELPASLGAAAIGQLGGVTFYDALHDPKLAALLLRGINDCVTAGPLRFVREPTAPIRNWPDCRMLGVEQSNTSLVFGDAAILKVLRRPLAGANPDLEVADALARLGSARVAAPYGWIETDIDGEPVLLAVLSEYLAHADDGWTLACTELSRLAARCGEPGWAQQGDLPFTGEARALGSATAELHADMAAAFGTRQMTRAELAALAGDLNSKLAAAVGAVPELGQHEAKLTAAFEAVARLGDPVTVQRIHGDYHLGQVLLGRHGWVALDFEGEPGVPLAQRRAMAPALRDVAGMMRSFDYAARHQLVSRPDGPGLAGLAPRWAAQCQAAFCAGYAAAGGVAPDEHGILLRALTLEKAVYEVIYEHRHRPAWMSIPLDFVAAA